MKIAILSDLHLEFYQGKALPQFPTDADVVVLAGDIHQGARGVDWADMEFRQPVIMTMGNHEAYGRQLVETIGDMRAASKGTTVRVLENDVVEIDGVRFIGCALWTDFALWGQSTIDEAFEYADARRADRCRDTSSAVETVRCREIPRYPRGFLALRRLRVTARRGDRAVSTGALGAWSYPRKLRLQHREDADCLQSARIPWRPEPAVQPESYGGHMKTIRLEARDPERNIARRYEIARSPDLFGWTLIEMRWGRCGSHLREKIVSAPTTEAADRFVRANLRKRAGAHKRIGVEYREVPR